MSEIEETREAGTYVVSLTDANATERALVGGKGANLAQLVDAGLPVPTGFCVTTGAYETLIDDPSIEDAIHELAALDPTDTAAIVDAGTALRARIQDCDVPDEIRTAIETAFDATASGPEQAYAVRSSATAEDLPEASFAGQQETFLNVGRDEIVDRVRACMASLFTDRAIAYRANNDIPHEEVALAVVVQRMITPDISGIHFTADPRTGNRHVASIEAGLGLGEALVSGEVTGDSVRVDTRTGEILDYEVGDQQIAVQPLDGGGTETVDLSPTNGDDRVLSDEQVRTLVEMGEEIEALFECPQDIEWCLDDGEVSIVQARPITSLFPLPDPIPRDDRLHVYLSIGHMQAMAEAMPPLAVDLWRTLMNDVFAEFGSDENSRWTVEAGGRAYFDITPFLQFKQGQQSFIDSIDSLNSPAARGLRELIEQRDEEIDNNTSLSSILLAIWNVGRIARTFAPVIPSVVYSFVNSFIRAGDDRDQVIQWWRSWGERTATEILESDNITRRTESVFETFSSNVIESMKEVYPPIMPLYAGIAADKGLRILVPDEHDTIDAAGRGFRDEVGTRMILRLNDLADIARTHPPVEEAIHNGASLDTIKTVSDGNAFISEFEDFLDEFGYRATGEIDVSRPRWRNDPAGLLQVIRGNLRAGEHDTYREHLRELEDEAAEAVAELKEKAGRGVFGPVCRRVVRRLLKVYRGYIPLRDEPKHGTARLFAAWHDGLQQAGEHLAAREQLESPDDVWYLRRDELFDLLASREASTPDIDGRRRDHERFKRLDAPPLLTSEGEAPTAAVAHNVGENTLVGTGVSSGIVEGTARVVFDPSETTLEPGEILVAPSCDPGWTPLFLNAAGLVTDVGGRMTHGALVAREYGLPGVMSVRKATSRIETGQRIRVDGSQGTVEIMGDG